MALFLQHLDTSAEKQQMQGHLARLKAQAAANGALIGRYAGAA